MENDDQRLSMSHISTQFLPDGVIRKFVSTQRLTPVKDQVSVEIHLPVKTQPIANSALLMTVGSSQVGKKSTARIKTGLTIPYKDKKPIFVNYHLQKLSLIAINF